jgi:hypothetical protein
VPASPAWRYRLWWNRPARWRCRESFPWRPGRSGTEARGPGPRGPRRRS